MNTLFDLSTRDLLPSRLASRWRKPSRAAYWWVFFGMLVLAVLAAIVIQRFPHSVTSAE